MHRNPLRFGSTTRRRFLKGSAAAGLALISLPNAARAAPEKKTIQIGVGPDFGTSGHAVVALEKGYFKDEGFEKVELRTFPAGLVQIEALAAGSIDLAMPTQAPVFTIRSNGIPIVILSSLAAYNDSLAVAVRDDKHVKNPTDLYGLKLGVLKGSGAEMMVDALIKHYKLDPHKIQMVNLAPPEQLSSLATGAIDAICVWQPWVYQAQSKVKVDIVHTGTESRFAQNAGEKVTVDWTRGLVTGLAPFVGSNPQTIDGVLQAVRRAQQFIIDPKNFDSVTAMFSKYHNQSAQMNAVVLKVYGPSIALDQRMKTDLEAVQDFLVQSGRMRKPIAVEDIMYGEPLKKIDPTLVSIATRAKV
jgi:ABC-type nitrate/sulfonate/bicarbonate transport system substrate-binding protein